MNIQQVLAYSGDLDAEQLGLCCALAEQQYLSAQSQYLLFNMAASIRGVDWRATAARVFNEENGTNHETWEDCLLPASPSDA